MTLEAFLASRYADDDGAARVMRQLDAAVRAAAPELVSAEKWRLHVYALDGDWRHWICGLNATRSAVCLRFRYGTLLPDPSGVMRVGSSTLTSWDLPRDATVDAAAVGAYVREAVARHPEHRGR